MNTSVDATFTATASHGNLYISAFPTPSATETQPATATTGEAPTNSATDTATNTPTNTATFTPTMGVGWTPPPTSPPGPTATDTPPPTSTHTPTWTPRYCVCTATKTPTPTCVHPVNFREDETRYNPGSAAPTYYYFWDSPTGELDDLADCIVGEYVTYPGEEDPFFFPSPPFWAKITFPPPGTGFDNPTVKSKPATDGWMQDTHGRHSPFVPPYTHKEVTATQLCRFHCDKCMAADEWETLMGPIPITRRIYYDDKWPAWFYELEKAGGKSSIAISE